MPFGTLNHRLSAPPLLPDVFFNFFFLFFFASWLTVKAATSASEHPRANWDDSHRSYDGDETVGACLSCIAAGDRGGGDTVDR